MPTVADPEAPNMLAARWGQPGAKSPFPAAPTVRSPSRHGEIRHKSPGSQYLQGERQEEILTGLPLTNED